MLHLLCLLTLSPEWARPSRAPLAVWRRIALLQQERHRRAVARRELRSMDESTLRDLGLSHRAAAEWTHIRDLP